MAERKWPTFLLLLKLGSAHSAQHSAPRIILSVINSKKRQNFTKNAKIVQKMLMGIKSGNTAAHEINKFRETIPTNPLVRLDILTKKQVQVLLTNL